MNNIDEALKMVDLFTSVGARSFVVTKTELEWPDHKKLKWGKTYSARELRPLLPAMVRTAAIRRPIDVPGRGTIDAGENLIIRPMGPDVAFVQLDDLDGTQLDRVRPAAFTIHTTSPGNFQAWIAVSGIPNAGETFKAFMRRVRKAVGGNDKAASGATRLSGTLNWKAKYLPDPPTVITVYAVPGRAMMPEQLQGMGLLADPKPVVVATQSHAHKVTSGHVRTWPAYAQCVANAPMNHPKTEPDTSRADFFWALMAAQRGHSTEDIAAKLMELSEKAKKNGEPYAHTTAENAAATAERGELRTRA
jgi:hypothetical protein